MVKVSSWTKQEDEYLIKWWHRKSNKEIGIDLGKNETNVRNRAEKIVTFEIMKRRKWSEFEDKLLLTLYGSIPIEDVCNRMKRSERGIIERLKKIEGSHDISVIQDVYTCYDISLFLGVNAKTVLNMYKRGQIPLHQLSSRRLVIDAEQFWEWLVDNLDIPNYLRIEDSTELISPEWYQKLIKKKKREKRNDKSYTKWTSKEDALLWAEVMKGTAYKEISLQLNRSLQSVNHRVSRLVKKKMCNVS